MREIKFRAWDTDKKEMAHVSHMNFDDYEVCLQNEGGTWYSAGHYTAYIMQCTGIKDKNGKDIYEGDIVKGHWYGGWPNVQHRLVGEVKYFRNSYLVFGVKQYTDICKDLTRDFEVIGNVYGNPELLEV